MYPYAVLTGARWQLGLLPYRTRMTECLLAALAVLRPRELTALILDYAYVDVCDCDAARVRYHSFALFPADWHRSLRSEPCLCGREQRQQENVCSI